MTIHRASPLGSCGRLDQRQGLRQLQARIDQRGGTGATIARLQMFGTPGDPYQRLQRSLVDPWHDEQHRLEQAIEAASHRLDKALAAIRPAPRKAHETIQQWRDRVGTLPPINMLQRTALRIARLDLETLTNEAKTHRLNR